ncbi:leukotriene A-4 hydrolase-like [Tropilaelaps mercedesae]|uniref:Leukotriene A-4 hydrolase-like n=1 Tax=Tropilaelaps mercedesae TaxID=418985 RepID=A0A1V9XP99_9ACAR|nr:leukotriene A-4 hydrolase-like [Tropilaelaps mercedesae]
MLSSAKVTFFCLAALKTPANGQLLLRRLQGTGRLLVSSWPLGGSYNIAVNNRRSNSGSVSFSNRFLRRTARTCILHDKLMKNLSGVLSVAALSTMAWLSPQDPNSFSRPDEVVVKSFHWDVVVDFEAKVLRGYVDLDVRRAKPDAQFLFLDSSKDLNIKEALCASSGQELDMDRSVTNEKFGVCTRIQLPLHEDHPKIRVVYETSPTSSALQWLTKEQTAGKHQPYLYSHSEAIHSRALLPCQDSPNVKANFTVNIQVPKGLIPVVSAVKVRQEECSNGNVAFMFEQNIPVPIYLLALAVGDLESREIGPCSRVWSEKEYVDQAVVDFADTNKMLTTAEDLMGPYVWGRYDLLVLPPSFPFGGMENPCLTFMTPTVLAGDKSLAHVVVHEISHSWTGNLVTNKNFEHFWLNEGFTTYVERKILGRMFGADHRYFRAQEGLKELKYTINTMGAENPLTALVVNLEGVDPDSSFSAVPYEKGHTFLYYLETLLGDDSMDAFLKAYIDRFKYKSIVTDDWKSFMYEFFANKKDILDKVDWNTWLYSPGMPPVIPEYKSELAVACRVLCEKWTQASDDDVKSFTNDEFKQMNANQKQEFFSELLELPPLSSDKVAHLSSLYEMDSIINAEIRFRWLRLGILARWEGIIDPVTRFIEVVGRMKFVKPLFRDLGAWPEKRKFAIELYERLKPGMMPDEAVATSFHWDVTVDFDAKVLRGHVDFNVSRRKDGAKYFILDSSIDLTIKKATHVHSGVTLNIDRTFRHENFGICVQITLPENEPSLTIRVEYETSPEASALFWLPKETTVGKRQPFLYSRAEIIHVR